MTKRISALFALRLMCLFILGLSLIRPAVAQQPFVTSTRWIQPGFPEDSLDRPCPVFRKTFTLRQAPSQVKLLITAHGLYEAALNGRRIGTAWFTPGITSYHRRLQYQEYDLTAQTQVGSNHLTVMVSDGWWRGRFGADLQNDRYGKDASLLAQLEITYPNGSRDTVITDSSWQSTIGPIRYADLYTGEIQDTRIEPGT
jgi:alpha-L-rhamnosidase